MPFEHPLGGFLTGTISHTVQDPAGINPPSTVIQTDDPWNVQVQWSIDGVAAWLLGGEWHLRVFAESIGPGPEVLLGTATVPLATVPPPPPRNFTHTINVPAGTLPEGTYRLVTVINYTNGGVPAEMAGFDDGTVIQLYNP
ncbi:MAG: hypothetical protein D6791_01225 [Chloroflexi bacterium]|nr:MAG: hypothetical protein D6791_01225 [Chloroflexota bacterium]